MKANELMIGDWVKVEDNFTTKITAIFGEMVQTQAEYQSEIDGEWYGEAEIKDLHPIPLTAEILEKNGFHKDLMYFYLNIDDEKLLEFYTHEKRLRLWFDGVDEWVKATIKDLLFQCQCKYVHQLQHALRLCGIDKVIEL